jgi:thiopurine S-methyltransferase
MKLGANYWKGRWERQEIGWHQVEPEPRMVSFFAQVPPTRVLVPLCGKSLDLMWLLRQGHEVIGVELSELGCESFFSENRLEFKIESSAGVRIYISDRIKLINQDIFSVDSSLLGRIGAIYDRAALIALPPEVRTRYSAHLISLAKGCSDSSLRFCQIVLERKPPDQEGPPFSVSEKELNLLYGSYFKIVCLSRELVSKDLHQQTDECVYELKKWAP